MPAFIPKEKFISLWVHAAITILLIVFGLIPLMKKMNELQQSIANTEIAALQESQLKVNSIKAKKEFDQFEGQQLLALALPAEDDIITFVETFEHAAQENSVVHNLELRTEGREEVSGVAHIPVQLNVTGSLNNIIQFLVDIEKEHFYINVKSISLGTEAGTDEQSLVIEGQTFWSIQQ